MYTEFYGKLGLIRTSLSKVHKRKILQSNFKKSKPCCYYGDDTLRLNKSLVRQGSEMNVLTFKPLVSINVVPPRSESIRRMSFKPFLVIGKPIIRSRQPHRPI